jgi:hypothetical protein
VDDDRLNPDYVHEGDVGEEFFAQGLIVEDTSAEFYDNNFAAKPADVFHRFDETCSFCNCLFQREYSGKLLFGPSTVVAFAVSSKPMSVLGEWPRVKQIYLTRDIGFGILFDGHSYQWPHGLWVKKR